MTESQKAFEIELLKLLPENVTANAYRLLKPSEFMLAQQFFNLGVAHGRKQALEDALAIVKNENKVGDMEFEIKELIK